MLAWVGIWGDEVSGWLSFDGLGASQSIFW